MFEIKNGKLIKYIEEKGLTDIVIPNNVINIGARAFGGCTHLTSITIPNSVISIGEFAFWGCTHLTSLIIPDSVISIGDCPFDGCISLTSITIPNSVANIGRYAFWDCISLTSITIPNSVISIGEFAFWGCTNLTSLIIPDSVISIGDSVFWGCTGLKSPIANYKAFDLKNGQIFCRDYKYTLGEWSEEIAEPTLCKEGYHFCTNLFSIFNYYAGEIDKDIAVYECEVGDKVISGDNKSVTNKIKPVKRLYRKDVIKILNNIKNSC